MHLKCNGCYSYASCYRKTTNHSSATSTGDRKKWKATETPLRIEGAVDHYGVVWAVHRRSRRLLRRQGKSSKLHLVSRAQMVSPNHFSALDANWQLYQYALDNLPVPRAPVFHCNEEQEILMHAVLAYPAGNITLDIAYYRLGIASTSKSTSTKIRPQ